MGKGQRRLPEAKDKIRYGVELGMILRRYFDNPPYIPPPQKIGFVWTPKLFATAAGFSDSAVRQWLRGDELPKLGMTAIIREIFGPDRDQFAEEIAELWATFRRCEDLKNGVRRSSKDTAATYRDLPSPPTEQSNSIPRPTLHFMGRDEEVAALAGLLIAPTNPTAVLVQGGPGMGKTELTKAVAHHAQVVARFAERRWFVPLETATTAAEMRHAIIRALGCDPKQGFQAVLDSLRGKQSLLILDNLETPWEPADQQDQTKATLADLSAVPGVVLLASFRGFEFVDGPLWRDHPVEPLPTSTAAKLFASRAGEWVLDDPGLDDFISALGGIPLAIDLVARRAHGRDSLALLWQEWTRIGVEFAKRPGAKPGRLTSLPHSIELSLAPLRSPDGDHPALRLFALLGVLPSGLGGEDAEALLGDDTFVATERLCHLGIVVERGNRVNLLPPIREYAAVKHPPIHEDLKRCMEYFFSLPSQFDEDSDKSSYRADRARVISEFPNIEVAWRHRILSGDTQSLLEQLGDILYVISRIFLNTSITFELSEYFKKNNFAFEQAYCLTFVNAASGYEAGARRVCSVIEEALTLFKSIEHRPGEAHCLFQLAETQKSGNYDLPSSINNYERAMEIYEEINDVERQALCWRGLGDVALACWSYDLAEADYRNSIDLFHRAGNEHSEETTMIYLDEAMKQRNHPHQAPAELAVRFQNIIDANRSVRSSSRSSP